VADRVPVFAMRAEAQAVRRCVELLQRAKVIAGLVEQFDQLRARNSIAEVADPIAVERGRIESRSMAVRSFTS